MTDAAAYDEALDRALRDQRLRQWIGSCLRKCRYRTQDMADHVADLARRRRGVQLRAYACDHCGGWHLTKVRCVTPPAARTADLFGRPPRARPRVLAKPCDHGEFDGRLWHAAFRCARCGYFAWLWRSKTECRRGTPCPTCNADVQ